MGNDCSGETQACLEGEFEYISKPSPVDPFPLIVMLDAIKKIDESESQKEKNCPDILYTIELKRNDLHQVPSTCAMKLSDTTILLPGADKGGQCFVRYNFKTESFERDLRGSLGSS